MHDAPGDLPSEKFDPRLTLLCHPGNTNLLCLAGQLGTQPIHGVLMLSLLGGQLVLILDLHDLRHDEGEGEGEGEG